jgi:hypothetical protein
VHRCAPLFLFTHPIQSYINGSVKLDARLNLRLKGETKQALAREAKRQRRSVNGLAQMILEDWVIARNQSGPSSTQTAKSSSTSPRVTRG